VVPEDRWREIAEDDEVLIGAEVQGGELVERRLGLGHGGGGVAGIQHLVEAQLAARARLDAERLGLRDGALIAVLALGESLPDGTAQLVAVLLEPLLALTQVRLGTAREQGQD